MNGVSTPRFLALVACVVALAIAACGADVDLGGATPDAGFADGTGVDSAAEHCGDLVGPDVTSTCRACDASADACQPNGCYGGYWCDPDERDCRTPPNLAHCN
jgi:hypothetical protein